jgi:hypothetical protein
MGFDQRPPTSGGVSPISSPNLPIADTSQAHDIPTGVGPSLAKLQDWIAWLIANGVLYEDPVGSPGLIGNDISIDGSLYVDLNIEAGQSVIVGNFLQFDGPGVTTGADPGADTYDSGNIPKVVGRIVTDGVGGYTVASSGKNLGLATLGATYLDINFIRPFANAEYTPVTSNISGTSDYATVDYANSTTTKIRLQMRDSTGALLDPSATVCRWSLIVMGRQ